MGNNNFFPERPNKIPTIYAYKDIRFPSLLKIGYTTVGSSQRVSQQFPIKLPIDDPYEIVF